MKVYTSLSRYGLCSSSLSFGRDVDGVVEGGRAGGLLTVYKCLEKVLTYEASWGGEMRGVCIILFKC